MPWTATPRPKWKTDDATLFPLILLMLGPVPETGWKMRAGQLERFTTVAMRVYKRAVDQYLYDNHWAAYTGPAEVPGVPDRRPWTFVASKRNDFLRWVWNTRFPDHDEKAPESKRKWSDGEDVVLDDDDVLKPVEG